MNAADGDTGKGGGDRPAADPAGGKHASPVKPEAPPGEDQPDWAKSLRQMYDGVVEEPLPPAFEQLLRSLDARTEE